MDTTTILSLLAKHVAQRSGISFADYGDRDAFMRDYRKVLQHGRDARTLLRSFEARCLTADQLTDQLRTSRLTLTDGAVDYCTGQYFPTEYRGAACRTIATAIWYAWRDAGLNREAIMRKARATFGRGIASRWFN